MPRPEFQTRLLTKSEYHNLSPDPTKEVTQTAEELLDIWPYVEEVFKTDLNAIDSSELEVRWVYEMGEQKITHVLIPLGDENIVLAVVIDSEAKAIAGHHVLNMYELYSLAPPKSAQQIIASVFKGN